LNNFGIVRPLTCLFSHRSTDEDASQLKTIALSLLSEMGCDGYELQEELYNEMCRFGAAEIHVVAALIGGITSQEVIKVRFISMLLKMVTPQYQIGV